LTEEIGRVVATPLFKGGAIGAVNVPQKRPARPARKAYAPGNAGVRGLSSRHECAVASPGPSFCLAAGRGDWMMGG
jgi:hypothetical protein